MVRRFIGPLLVLALAACQAPTPTEDLGPLDIAKPVHVDRVRVQYAAAFEPGKSDLSADEALRFETFLDQTGLRPEDSVFIAMPPGDSLAPARAGYIAALLAQRSVGMIPIAPPPTGVVANHLLILVDRYVATAPPCPNWSGPPETGHDNVPGSNFGCANAVDLSEMVANPRDLMVGRDLSPADAAAAIAPIERYRTGQVKPLLSASQGGSSQGSSATPTSGGASGAAPSGAGSPSSSGSSQ